MLPYGLAKLEFPLAGPALKGATPLSWIVAALVGCSEPPSGADYSTFDSVVLNDVQGLYGGHDFDLKRDGTWVMVEVTPRKGLHARRFEGKASEADIAAFINLLQEHDFLSIRTSDRPGVPDEALPTITVSLTGHESVTKRKWARDKHPDFDAIYGWIMVRCRAAAAGKPVHEGAYE